MKQLLILSGKGGTGKTTIASSFIELSDARAFADCDVEAPNLHLLNHPGVETKKDYYGMKKAIIHPDKCISCGLCIDKCRFDAIKVEEGDYKVDLFACEGCRVCEYVCPVDAIKMVESVDGIISLYQGEKLFSTAELNMGSGNSGKLVTEVKQNLKDHLTDEPLVIIDGSPGIGCPVIASLSGVDMVLIVTEPTISGISDMKRILSTAKHFKTKTAVCINKYNVNETLTQSIETFCNEEHIPFVGRIPYDKEVLSLLNQGKSVMSKDFPVSISIKEVYQKTMNLL